jgi:hypothetical protein
MNSNERRAVIRAQRAYKGAKSVGAPEYIAIDVACAAYRVAHPVMDDQTLRTAVARKIGLITEDAAIAVEESPPLHGGSWASGGVSS